MYKGKREKDIMNILEAVGNLPVVGWLGDSCGDIAGK